MSTKMYAYRVEKAQLWPLVDQVRDWYEKNEAVFYLMDAHRKTRANQELSAAEHFAAWSAGQDLAADRGNYVELQLFDEGDTWLCRVLERGYAFMNHYEKEHWPIEGVFYDDRSDMPEEWEKNLATVDWMEEKIQARHWFCVDIVAKYILADYLDREEMG